MLKLLKSPLLLFSLCLGSTYACVQGEKGCDVNKSDWTKVMKYRMPISFCTNKSPFVKCTNINQEECKEFTTKAVEQCLSDNDKNIPSFLNKIEAGNLGAQIGDCTGRKLFNHVIFKETKDESCSEWVNPSN
jgi:hypothetical protein